ncbi:MAG: glycosyl transferase family 4 [Xanthomonadaceae bacterium]|nr:glycosyl transferase family 4 [Xanthomonadaceae bacterium]MDE1957869.1 glycosyl transferase family 4 [Xanthomonadaceae bacterium]MDE2177074.1 glycosyl transferase family 4 [Xanthomonadaceae bacterium]MDE2246554.1 glycosyl transferase family 4 [Xanthomonadaceae bacterium]
MSVILPPLVALLIAAATVAAGMTYARWRGLLDTPGRRRLHQVPTPRGGGVGIVLAALIVALVPAARGAWSLAPALGVAWLGGALLVAAVGYADDHRHLPAWLRLLAHLAAALLLAMALGLPARFAPVPLLWRAGILLATVWSINLHNFMDGSNGLLALQALFVLAAIAALASAGGAPGLALVALVLAAATLGFLPFNFPRARVFMGDVGSGTLGFLIAAVALTAIARGALGLAEAAVVVSAFAVDASCTLLSRLLRGRRWYRPHREHLYQWIARVSGSHVRAAAYYSAWNLLLAGPVLLLMRVRPAWAWPLAVAVLICAMLTWWFGRRACLRAGKNAKLRHAPA